MRVPTVSVGDTAIVSAITKRLEYRTLDAIAPRVLRGPEVGPPGLGRDGQVRQAPSDWDYPPRQRALSFSIDQAVEKLRKGLSSK
jgi:hypothetical protein